MCDDVLESLQSAGFCVMDRYLKSETVQSLASAFETLDDGEPAPSRREASTREKRGVVFARRNLLSLGFVREFIASEPVLTLIERIDSGAVAVRAILFDKTGEANWTVPWHQDRSIAVAAKLDVPGFGPWSEKAGVVHVQPPVSVLHSMVTLRFSLDSCGPDNGPLRTIAATHHRILSPAEVEQAVKNEQESTCTMSAGGVVVMRPLVLHASSPAKTIGHRRVLHIEYGPPCLPGGLRWARV